MLKGGKGCIAIKTAAINKISERMYKATPRFIFPQATRLRSEAEAVLPYKYRFIGKGG